MIYLDEFESKAAWLEYCDGMSRFAAETEAAKRQGVKRWEMMNEIKRRDIERARDNCSPAPRRSKGNMSQVQRDAKEKKGSVFERDIQA